MKIKENSICRTVDAFLLKEEGSFQTAFVVLDSVVLKMYVSEKCERIDAVEIHEVKDNELAGMNVKSLLQAKDFTWLTETKEDIFPISLPMIISKGTVFGIFNGALAKEEVIS